MSSKETRNRIAGVIIAAGESKRLGIPKQLLLWRGKTMIEFVVEIARESGLCPIHVVIGAYKNVIEPMLTETQARIIENPFWKEGKGRSISAGIQSLAGDVKAAIIFVVDQPFLNKKLVLEIIESYTLDDSSQIVAPFVEKTQANPVLFDKSVFPELIKLTGECGGRDIFSRYKLKKLLWEDEKILKDIDSLSDYKNTFN